MTNLYLKRLIRKGYVKSVTVSPHRLVYSLTPKGIARKARLTYEFMKYSLDFYHDARRHLRRSLARAVSQQQRVAIYGTGDAAELVYLLVRELGLELVAVFGSEPGNGSTGSNNSNGANGSGVSDASNGSTGHFLGLPVTSVARHADVAYDVLVVAVLERPAGTAKLLARAGIPAEKMLMLRPDWPATRSNGKTHVG